MPSEAYPLIDRQWKAACRAILGFEPSELKAYEGWLTSHMSEHRVERLAGGREAMYQFENFAPSARKVDFASVDFMKKYPPLSANEMKDIDSIAQAIGERAKRMLLAEITSSLEKTGDYERSIYGIAPAKKQKQ
jgi:hypothetical protein